MGKVQFAIAMSGAEVRNLFLGDTTGRASWYLYVACTDVDPKAGLASLLLCVEALCLECFLPLSSSHASREICNLPLGYAEIFCCWSVGRVQRLDGFL